MADLTVSVACMPQKNELCNSGSNQPVQPPPSRSCNNTHSDKVVIDLALCSCSNLCKSVEANTIQYNGNVEPETDVTFSKGSQNVNYNDDLDNHGSGCLMCVSHHTCQAHTPSIKFKSYDKCNGVSHHHTAAEPLLVNVINAYKGEVLDTKIHGFNKDLNWECESSCQCTTKVDSDYMSCDEIETEKICSPEVCCHNNCGVDTLLTDLERTSIHQHSNSSEPFIASDDVINGVTYVVYESEKQMPDIMRLITKDLSEPYSIYTYRYFIHNWPKLCFLALCDTNCVGAIVCKLDLHKKMVRRGYIAMLAVDSEYRRRKIGSILVTKAIEAMIKDDCDEVVLETEITNQSALHLYENLGFVRDKRLFRYYLNGVDALRLKLWLR